MANSNENTSIDCEIENLDQILNVYLKSRRKVSRQKCLCTPGQLYLYVSEVGLPWFPKRLWKEGTFQMLRIMDPLPLRTTALLYCLQLIIQRFCEFAVLRLRSDFAFYGSLFSTFRRSGNLKDHRNDWRHKWSSISILDSRWGLWRKLEHQYRNIHKVISFRHSLRPKMISTGAC